MTGCARAERVPRGVGLTQSASLQSKRGLGRAREGCPLEAGLLCHCEGPLECSACVYRLSQPGCVVYEPCRRGVEPGGRGEWKRIRGAGSWSELREVRVSCPSGPDPDLVREAGRVLARGLRECESGPAGARRVRDTKRDGGWGQKLCRDPSKAFLTEIF